MKNQEIAYQFLKNNIISGRYKQGHVFSENQMSIRLDMSRTPIREAFKELENEGLIERHKQTTKVSTIDKDELKENFELRSMLESYALKRKFSQLKKPQLELFKEKLLRISQNRNWSEYLKVDEAVHEYLTKDPSNSTLQKTLDLLQSQTNRMRYAISDNHRCTKTCALELIKIIEAIETNDKDLAVLRLKNHITNIFLWEDDYFNRKENNYD